MNSEKISGSEGLYKEHKDITGHGAIIGYERKRSYNLEEAQQRIDRFSENLRRENLLWKAVFYKFNKDELKRLTSEKDFFQKLHDQNIQQAQGRINEFHEEALEFAEQYETYARLQQLLGEATGSDPLIRDTNHFLRTCERLEFGFREPKDRVKAAAIIDYLNPSVDEPLEIGKWRSQKYIRVPRVDAGVPLEAAIENAEKKEYQYLLRIRKTGAHYLQKYHPAIFGNLPIEGKNVETEDVYMPIPQEAARILQDSSRLIKDELNHEIIFFPKGSEGNYGKMDFFLNFEFEVVDLPEARQLAGSRKAVLKLELTDVATSKTEGKEIELTAKDVKSLYDEIVRQILDFEMGTRQMMAKNIRIRIGDEEIPFEELRAIMEGKSVKEDEE